MARYALYIVDLDGTLWRGEEPIASAAARVAALRAEGAWVRFLTNNSTQTRAYFAAKLTRMGFPATEEEVMTTSYGAAKVLVRDGHRTVHVLGEDGLKLALRQAALEIADGPADALLVGLSRTAGYQDLDAAMQAGLAGAKFYATNIDATFPLEGGRLAPGAGVWVTAMETCLGRIPVVIGKPEPLLIELILSETGVPASQTLVVGDRIETDIQAGMQAGCATWLVLTGVATELPPGVPGSLDLADVP